MVVSMLLNKIKENFKGFKDMLLILCFFRYEKYIKLNFFILTVVLFNFVNFWWIIFYYYDYCRFNFILRLFFFNVRFRVFILVVFLIYDF